MAWQDEMVLMVRYLVDDIAETYSDDRLEHTVVVSAQLVNLSVDFDNTYTIDMEQKLISPDPTTLTTKDDAFINLVTLKACEIIASSEYKTAANQAFSIKDAWSTVTTSDRAKHLKERSKYFKDMYDSAVVDYKVGDGMAGQAVMTPTTVETLYPTETFR
jgi:hypothetical protein